MTKEQEAYAAELAAATKANRVELDDYLSSVQGLHAFSDSARWNEAARAFATGSHYSIPRTMTAVQGKDLHNVTPDCVVQRDPSYGVIAEMKKHYRDPVDVSAFDQIAKYDDDLIGWWTEDERIATHDLVLLTHYLSSTNAVDAFKYWKSKGGTFQRAFAVVEFNFSSQATPSFTLKRVAGRLLDGPHDEVLRHGKPIPERFVLDYLRRYKFYDARPPLMHLMLLIHDYVLPTLLNPNEFDGPTGPPQATVTTDQVRAILQEQFGRSVNASRQPTLPKRDWVELALEEMTRISVARASGKGPGRTYRFVVRKPQKKDTVEFLTDRILRQAKQEQRRRGAREAAAEPVQLPLFEESE